MSVRVSLVATGGPLAGQEFTFTDRTICTVGRAEECLLRIEGSWGDLTLSRRHCVLDIDPPAVQVRDLGSRNGTYVNDVKVGQRDPEDQDDPGEAGEWVELHDGDRLAIGASKFVLRLDRASADEGTAAELQGQGVEEAQGLAVCS